MFQLLVPKPQARAVVFMGSPTDMSHCEKIRTNCQQLGVPCELRVSSAHKATEETMKILAEYEGGVSELIYLEKYFVPNSENKKKKGLQVELRLKLERFL